MTAVLFVCLGNICRSPTAEAVFRRMAHEAGLDAPCESAGTGGWNAGKPPYTPSILAARRRGYEMAGFRARQVRVEDFRRFGLILGMDRANLKDLRSLRPGDGPEPRLLMDYAPNAPRQDIPDPWYTRDFEGALDLIEEGCRGLVAALLASGRQGGADRT
jgi:protein-tyrosine phosphatase